VSDTHNRRAPDSARPHLERLAGVLQRRGWQVRLVTGPGEEACLRVTNPNAPVMSERVMCRRGPDFRWHFSWPWRQSIGSTDQVSEVADAITKLLREID
jgi:hypothetical protein